MKSWLKQYTLYARNRHKMGPEVQIAQRALYVQHRQNVLLKRYMPLKDTGYRVFSQFEEDGKILYIFSVLGMTNPTFVEVGSDDGLNSNAANLCMHFGWRGLFIDGNEKAIRRGRWFYARYPHRWMYQPVFVAARVTRQNINNLITDAGFSGEIGFLSIDIDGNDYWIWDAIEVVQPQVVMIETHNEFGMHNVVAPYRADYVYRGEKPAYHGASPIAMTRLANRKGYRLIGANDLGFNFIYVKRGLAEEALPEVTVASVLTHPNALIGQEAYEQLKDRPFEAG